MTAQQSWARHYQHAWAEKAGNPGLPLWLRVACLAFGHHLGNGHATFGPGEVRLTLTSVDRDGVLREPTSSDVSRAIKTAVRYGWLVEGSRARCLVVPGHAITGGRGVGTEHVPCREHHTDRRAKRHRRPVAV
ncbi:hypothetical protein [Geodermatophilus sp. SYSU D00710]